MGEEDAVRSEVLFGSQARLQGWERLLVML